MSVKARLGWLLNGSANTSQALTGLGDDLRELQHKVDGIVARLDALDARCAGAPSQHDIERLTETVETMRGELRTVTDDLGDRVGAVAGLLNRTG